MPTRIETPFTNEHFAAFCQKMVGQPYWYGTTGHRATESLLKRKTAQYPTHYTSSRTSRYKKDIENKAIVCDCIGGCKAYAWTGGGESLLRALKTGESFSSKYGANGCPDRSANGMFTYAKSKGMPYGEMSSLPDLNGIALWKDGHVGYTVGNGKCVEWRSFSYGCVTTAIARRGFEAWFFLPFLDYGENLIIKRDLKRGMTGKEVAEMQKQLMNAGYALPKYGADGDFGRETEAALKKFQADNGLKSDGVFTQATREALSALTETEETDKKPAQDTDNQRKIIIRSHGGSVNLRYGNGTEYEKAASAGNGEKFVYVATADNGWHAVKEEKAVLWVSGEYSILEEP